MRVCLHGKQNGYFWEWLVNGSCLASDQKVSHANLLLYVVTTVMFIYVQDGTSALAITVAETHITLWLNIFDVTQFP